MNKSKTYCSLPWVHLSADPSGMASLCCVSDHTNNLNTARNFNTGVFSPLSLNEHKISDLINSDYFKQTRLKMLNSEIPDACRRCFEAEKNGGKSKRTEENEKLKFTEQMARDRTSSNGEISMGLRFVELRLGNLCNIKCRSCNPASSSRWSGEYQRLQNDLDFVAKYEKSINCSWTESDEFWQDFLDNCQDVELLYINGGEPTLVEKHWNFLESLIERGHHKNITLWYNINMTNLPGKLVQLWQQFKKVIVFASIDDLGDRNSYLRTGSKWEEIISNLNKLQTLKWIETSVCQTVSWNNVYYLDEFYKFMGERRLDVHLNFVYDPKFLNPVVLTDNLKKIVLEKVKSIHPGKYEFLKNHLLANPGNIELLRQGILYNEYLDKQRQQSFADACPDWHEIVYRETALL